MSYGSWRNHPSWTGALNGPPANPQPSNSLSTAFPPPTRHSASPQPSNRRSTVTPPSNHQFSENQCSNRPSAGTQPSTHRPSASTQPTNCLSGATQASTPPTTARPSMDSFRNPGPFSPRRSAQQPQLKEMVSPIFIGKHAKWVCRSCGVPHSFSHTSEFVPLGFLKCGLCCEVANFAVEIRNLPHLVPIDGVEFALSLPPDQLPPPRTVFVWACCSCGRSHRQFTFHVRRLPTPPPMPEPKARHSWSGRKLFRRSKKEHDEPDRPLLQVIHAAPGSFSERKSYTVKFDTSCECSHKVCDLCFKAKVEHEGEWVTSAQGQLVYGPEQRWVTEQRVERASLDWPR